MPVRHGEVPGAVPRRQRGAARVLLAFGVLGCAGGLAILGTLGPAWADQQAYRRAQPCGAHAGRCLTERDGVVVLTGVRYAGRHRQLGHEYALLRVDGRPVEVEYAGSGGTTRALAAGGAVRVVLWEGKIVRVEGPGVRVETFDSPEGRVAPQAAVGFLVGSLGALLGYAGYLLRDNVPLDLVTKPWPHRTAGYVIGAAVLSSLALLVGATWRVFTHPLALVLYASPVVVGVVRLALARRGSARTEP